MAQLVVRNLDDALKERLRRTAAAHGRSMEEEVRVILHNALDGAESPAPRVPHVGLGEQIHNALMGVEFPPEFFDSLEEIRKGSDLIRNEPREVNFDE